MPLKITPQEYAEKQARRLKASTQDIARGIDRVTESPTELAAAKQDKMLANLTEAVHSGKWAKGLRRVSLAEWKAKTKDKGIPRIAAGIDAARDKVVSFASELLPYEANLQAEVDGMPDLTLEDSIARMTVWTRGMASFTRSG